MLMDSCQGLARALYSRADIAILDDSFSAMDRITQSQVINNLLGPEGMLRSAKTTVLCISTASELPCPPHFYFIRGGPLMASSPVL